MEILISLSSAIWEIEESLAFCLKRRPANSSAVGLNVALGEEEQKVKNVSGFLFQVCRAKEEGARFEKLHQEVPLSAAIKEVKTMKYFLEAIYGGRYLAYI